MKKILILTSKNSKNRSNFYENIKNKLPKDIDIIIANFEDVIIEIEEKNTTILLGELNIKEFDLIYFRRAGSRFLWLAASIALYLDSINKTYIDSTYKDIGPAGTKLTSFLRLSLSGLPMIPSIYCYRKKILDKADLIISKLGLPLVAKELYSQRGIGVSLITSKADFERLLIENPGKKFMFQKYIDKREEFRILVLGEKIGSFERKTSADPDEFRNNVSLGANEEFIGINDISEELKYVSIKSAKVLRLEIAGVDIAIDKEGKLWLLEVNRGPGFTYDSAASPELASITDFFVQELKNK